MSFSRREVLRYSVALSAGSMMSPLGIASSEVKKNEAMPGSMPFRATWNSLREIKVPEWLRNGKFGIYTHWGIIFCSGLR